MAAELPLWAVRIREERIKRLWSQKAIAVRLRDAADEQTRASLPSIENIKRRVRGHEAGQNQPGDLYIELYCRAFGLTRQALLGAPSPPDVAGGDSFPTEGDAAGLVSWVASSNTTDDAIQHLDAGRAALAEAHTRSAPGRVLADVFTLHRQIQALLHGGRQRLWQSRELFRIDSDLLAHASLLLDDIHHNATALAHGQASALCAEEAGCSPALALSAQAKSARWQGARLSQNQGAPYFARSADLARRGFERSPQAPVRVLLASQEASAAALLGDATRARRALRDAQDAAGSVNCVDSGLSTWSCPGPRQGLYMMSVAIRLRDPDEALRAAEMADARWAAGDPWLYGVWSLVRIGAGMAYVMKSDLDAAAEQLKAVLALPPAFRIATITSYLTDLDWMLHQRRFAGAPKCQELRQQIATFTTAALPTVINDEEDQ
jgi:hypothetical protein